MKDAINYMAASVFGLVGVLLALLRIPTSVPGDWGVVASNITPIIGFVFIIVALLILVRSMM